MSTDYDSFVNRGEYFAAHYFAEQLPADLKKHLLDLWTLREGDADEKQAALREQAGPGERVPARVPLTPRERLRTLRTSYLGEEGRSFFAQAATADAEDEYAHRSFGNPDWTKRLADWHQQVLGALGFDDAAPGELTVHRSGRDHSVSVAYHGNGIVALDCGWTGDVDEALNPSGAGRLLHPLRTGASECYTDGAALASWLFASRLGGEQGTPPRFVLLLIGGVLVLADRNSWGEGRYLAVSLDAALERNDRKQGGELATIAALFSQEMLRPGNNSASPLLDTLLAASSTNAVGVSGELRDGLQRSVEIIAQEVLDRLAATGLSPADIEDGKTPFAKQLTRETLRYLYRILFLLYAEARPELGILPADDGSYEAGYSVARLRELVARDQHLVDPAARDSFHLYASLAVLCANVNFGHRAWGSLPDDDQPGDDEATRQEKAARRSEDRGLRFEPLHSTLFEPGSVKLIGCDTRDPRADDDHPAWLDLRLRNSALHQVLRLLTMKDAKRGERGGFISYRNLGINQLGAVYEGLMSYTGFIADQDLIEVAKGGDPKDGSWMIPADRQDQYPDEVFVQYDEHDVQRGLRGRKRYPRGSFVYRLAGRDRQTSASYYTPESLTKVTVELALKHRLDQQVDVDGNPVRTRAAELLKFKICEPALGSGAFLNEAINQVAKEYLLRRQEELGTSIPTSQALTEEQRAKAYIALHNAYGVDLNATGVELAEVSLWLNTMHPGMRAPWFGLHLRRGNSLIGGRRVVFSGEDITAKDKAWLKAKGGLAPTPLPFLSPDGGRQELPEGAVHQFLLPAAGWGAVAGEKEAKELAPVENLALAAWRKGILKPPTTKATRGTKLSQLKRLQAVSRRAEFLWELVVRRMEVSEDEIARHIEVWGTGRQEGEFSDEYDFLKRPEGVVPKEKVFRDLFQTEGTPYWRLKTMMDAWCALWFWPLDAVDLIDGSAGVYAESGDGAVEAALAALPQVGAPEPAPEPVAAFTFAFAEQDALFGVEGEQVALTSAVQETTPAEEQKPQEKRSRAPRRHRTPPKRRPAIPLCDLADWIDFAEALLGTYDPPADSLIGDLDTLDAVEAYEDGLPLFMGMDSPWKLDERFPWLRIVQKIAEQQGFLHWELDFGAVFARNGGFDLQVGNPPWVRPRWDEPGVLAEHEPWFKLTEKASVSEKQARKGELLRSRADAKRYVLTELTNISTQVALLSSEQVYPLLTGTQPDLYRAFMCQVWAHSAPAGTAGLVHPDSHFSGDKEGALREAAYRRLRIHGDFVNAGNRFFPHPVGRHTHFGVHIYGAPGQIAFSHLSWLFAVDALRLSATAEIGEGEPDPGVRYKGTWDERPNPLRIVRVDKDVLALWQRLTGEEGQPVERARLLSPVSTAEAKAIAALAKYPVRLADFLPQISRGFDESGAKRAGLIDYNRIGPGEDLPHQPADWDEVILKGPQLGVANPMFKQPSDADERDFLGLNLVRLEVDAIPGTEYVRAIGETAFVGAQDRWVDYPLRDRLLADPEEVQAARVAVAIERLIEVDEVTEDQVDGYLTEKARRPYSDFYRLAWRRQIAPNTERSLYAAVIPPGATHVHTVHSLAAADPLLTVLAAGFWASLPQDYFLRTTGRSDLGSALAKVMPSAAAKHPLAPALLLRTLRLNCVTRAYAELWTDLYNPHWLAQEPWAYEWPGLSPLHAVEREWSETTPLRTERERRSVLVEIDALVAVWLGVDADALAAMYLARFPVLQDFDAATWFDANGRKIAGHRYTYGHGQTKEDFAQFQKHLAAPAAEPAPASYTPPFYKADREAEMRAAHKVFQERLDAAVARGEWDPVRQEVPEL